MDEELAVTLAVEIDGEAREIEVSGDADAVKALLVHLGATPEEAVQASDSGEAVATEIVADSADLVAEEVAP